MFQIFMEQYAFIFIAAIITFGLLVMLRSFAMAALQVVVLMTMVMMAGVEFTVYPMFVMAQFILSGLVIYKFLQALDMNYRLVLEKTHEIEPNLTKQEHRGSRFSFWNTK
ncbi:hypothetical protein [Virgibacillus doumboii]|uniref:hypothetical protein n=1 Tax=Virgibacillus doumboii TaxID=2697503 RepID=UPI0013DF45BC|nr:hypothetical protein [Virgibacillus doumboii]